MIELLVGLFMLGVGLLTLGIELFLFIILPILVVCLLIASPFLIFAAIKHANGETGEWRILGFHIVVTETKTLVTFGEQMMS